MTGGVPFSTRFGSSIEPILVPYAIGSSKCLAEQGASEHKSPMAHECPQVKSKIPWKTDPEAHERMLPDYAQELAGVVQDVDFA